MAYIILYYFMCENDDWQSNVNGRQPAAATWHSRAALSFVDYTGWPTVVLRKRTPRLAAAVVTHKPISSCTRISVPTLPFHGTTADPKILYNTSIQLYRNAHAHTNTQYLWCTLYTVHSVCIYLFTYCDTPLPLPELLHSSVSGRWSRVYVGVELHHVSA